MTNPENSSHNYAVVFPGQGSQSLAMLDGWSGHSELLDNILQEADECLGYDIGGIIQSGPLEKLNQTEITQPAMLIAGVLAWRVWLQHCKSNNLKLPAYLAGHSLGEYSALVAAGVLSFGDALQLVEYRGQCMQDAVPAGTGAMAAILGLNDEEVVQGCAMAAEVGIVEAVNFNAPGQVVIAGEKAAVEKAQEVLKESGARRVLPLPVSVPSHCQLMIPAAKRLANRLDSIEFNVPSIPVIHNTDVETHREVTDIKKVLVRQLHNPVRWVESMQKIQASGTKIIIECGPGKVLSGLQKRISRDLTAFPLFDNNSLLILQEAFAGKA
ncbi:MAG: ACP S-malonyltransferase [Gammaproteobacteria bacterium]|nr:ACP S-malonyltransferase [Gammaproteobacteria bacterium]NNC97369.1 ACP S-malonyltransferase [Gammaproteobacteria bacterium]NNM13112.1 ACP S-malonyltransferase [Gammaproteobacteria bacterium]